MTHVFIVNEQTIKIHLEYLFAGTGSSNDAPFLLEANYHNPQKKQDGVTSSAERNLAAMIADISRIRTGDKILFYLQASSNSQGMFFGIFEAISKAFYQPNDDNYLTSELGKSLNFRILIKGHKVYSKGITEHEALDNFICIEKPYEICWSLIYRKLKGNRGCTMITDKEAERLFNLLSIKNQGNLLSGNSFSFCNNEIVETQSALEYTGSKLNLDILPRLIYKTDRNNKCESHFQAYIVQNIDKKPLKNYLNINNNDLWIGNEVSCGVGMQKMDIVTMQETDQVVTINIIELKCTEAYNDIIDKQIPWYIEWTRDYIVPTFIGKRVFINPIVISKKFSNDTNKTNFKNHCNTLYCNNATTFEVSSPSLITYNINENNVSFTKEF